MTDQQITRTDYPELDPHIYSSYFQQSFQGNLIGKKKKVFATKDAKTTGFVYNNKKFNFFITSHTKIKKKHRPKHKDKTITSRKKTIEYLNDPIKGRFPREGKKMYEL